MRKTFLAVVWMAMSLPVRAQVPYLVTDINTSYTPTAQSSLPRSFTQSSGSVYFSASTLANGNELYKTDGATVSLVKDLVSGTSSGAPGSFVDLGNGTFVFAATDSTNGRELWSSDGSEGGTMFVKDILPGSGSSSPVPMVMLGGKAFLLAGSTTSRELWITDGQEAGTQKLANLQTGSFRYAIFGGVFYFATGDALWRSDGTVAGTSIVKSGIYPRAIVATTDRLFLAAWDSGHGYELWQSDGTDAGTVLIKDINPGAAGSFVTTSEITMGVIGTSVVFFAFDGEHSLSLFRSDGTEGGTLLYHELPSGSAASTLWSSAGVAFFVANSSLWRTDATSNGTFSLSTVVSPYAFVPTPATLFFVARTASTGFRLWKSDGSDVGTAQISPTAQVSEADPQLRYAGGKLYFAGYTGTTGGEPWVSDGTAAGTMMLANLMPDPPASANPTDLRASGGKLFFLANDGSAPPQLWSSDGTGAGTQELTNFTDIGSLGTSLLTPWNGQLLFRRGYNELWKSDGTLAGTALLKQFGSIDMIFPSSTYAYFLAYASSSYYDYKLWRTDGTEAGTIVLATVGYSSSVIPVGELAGRFYFISNASLWQTDGTPASTKPIASLAAYNGTATLMGGSIFYASASSYPNYELWKSDGTPEGGALVKEIRPGTAGSNPHQFTPAGSLLFFLADDGTHGDELWRTDGTDAGTFLLKDILPGTPSSQPNWLTVVDGVLYFVANDGVNGAELWKSDGTIAGTSMVADLGPGSASSDPQFLAAADGKLFFSATDSSAGAELWTSDGTAPGTVRVADLESGTGSSSPRDMTSSGRRLYFGATTTATGRELYALALAASAFSIADARVVEGDGGSPVLHFTVTRSGDTSQAASVNYATSDGSAQAGSDYTAQSGTLNFAVGAASAAIDVPVTPDDSIERNESLFVTLSAPSLGVFERNTAVGVIEDDDRTSALSIGFVHVPSDYSRKIVVTNAGPSSATGITVVYTESPGVTSLSSGYDNGGFTCTSSGKARVICTAGILLPGESRTINLSSSHYDYYVYYDTANPPGQTMTATVSAAEVDPDLTDNTISRMQSANGFLMTPPFLVANTNSTAEYMSYYPSSSGTTVPLTSTNPLVVPSPPSQTIPAGQQIATFTLQTGNGTGTTKLTADAYTNMTIAIVQPAQTPKLDVAIRRPSLSYDYEYGRDVTITLEVLARKGDGTLPTGTIDLLDSNDNILAQASLVNESVTFTRSGLSIGTYAYRARYNGDANFNPLTATLPSFTVRGWRTYTSIVLPKVLCSNLLDVVVYVVAADLTHPSPTGQVKVTFGNQIVTLDLTPDEPGTSKAATQLVVSQPYYSFQAQYLPTGTYDSSYNYGYPPTPGSCVPLSLSAVATATNRVSLTWNPTGASSYEIYRNSGSYYGFDLIGNATTNAYLDTQVQPDHAYVYRVRPIGGAFSEPEIAVTKFFADDPIVPGVTKIKALHFTDLRTVANLYRTVAGLAQMPLGATPPVVNTVVRPLHITELRQTIDEARRFLGVVPVGYTDPALAAGMTIKAVHLQELRNALK